MPWEDVERFRQTRSRELTEHQMRRRKGPWEDKREVVIGLIIREALPAVEGSFPDLVLPNDAARREVAVAWANVYLAAVRS